VRPHPVPQPTRTHEATGMRVILFRHGPAGQLYAFLPPRAMRRLSRSKAGA